jgi:heparan-alpha-glucosaminide N-acetyltransferase
LQWFLALDLVLAYLLITYLVHKPGCPVQYSGPGGELGDYGKYSKLNCTGGAAGYIDEMVFGPNHIYQTPSCQKMYLTGPYDPEGILGSLTGSFLAFLGLHAGRILLLYSSNCQRITRLIVNGFVWGIIGAGLCEFKQNGGFIPINKNLWSVSYTLVMAGTAFVLLALMYYFIDIKRAWSGAPFYFIGMNSILVYVGHELVHGYFPFDWNSDETYTTMMARNVTGTMLWVIIGYYLYKVKIFVKV